jgi:hypothetical protein
VADHDPFIRASLPAVVADNHRRATLLALVGSRPLGQPVELLGSGGCHQERPHGRRPAAGGHPRRSWVGRLDQGGAASRDWRVDKAAVPCIAVLELEAEDGVDLIGVEWRRHGDAVAGLGRQRRPARRTAGVGGRRHSDGRRERGLSLAHGRRTSMRVWFSKLLGGLDPMPYYINKNVKSHKIILCIQM